MAYVSYDTDLIIVDFGGVAYDRYTPDQNQKSISIGGSKQPLIAFAIRGASGAIPYPSDDYEDEPYAVYLNGRLVESGTLPSPDTSQVTSIVIDTPTASSTITTDGTATASVYDQFGEEMLSGFTLEWDCDGTHIDTIDETSGAYTVGTDGAGSISVTATDSTKESATAAASVTVTVSVPAPNPDPNE